MELEEKISQINSIITNESWYDMEMIGNRGGNLIIAGSIDFTYGHSLEIIFEDVFHMSINVEWRTDTSKPMLEIVSGEEALAINIKYQIEQGNVLFKINSEDTTTSFYVAAMNLSFNKDKVLYYKKDDLGENERIADWFE